MKFKVGDKVVVYGILDKSIPERAIAEIKSIHDDGNLRLVFRNGSFSMSAFPQQCRRLVKKPRRKLWIGVDNWNNYRMDNPAYAYPNKPALTGADWRLFIEARPKRK